MSLYAVEKVFWEFGTDYERVGRFMSNPDEYLEAYKLTDEERRAIKEVDLKALVSQGVSPLLTVMIWPILKGPEGMPMAYLNHMAGRT